MGDRKQPTPAPWSPGYTGPANQVRPSPPPAPPAKRYERSDVMEKALRFIETLKRGDCWCDVGIEHPSYSGKHSKACYDIQAFMREQGR